MKKFLKLNKLFFVLFFFAFMLSCENNKENIDVLNVKNTEINIIIDSLLTNKWYGNGWQTLVCTLNIYKEVDSIKIQTSFMLREIPKEEIEYYKNNLYGFFMLNKKPILVYGDYAPVLFDKTSKKKNLDFLSYKNAISDEDYVPPVFDPDEYIYYLNEKDNKIEFIYYGFR